MARGSAGCTCRTNRLAQWRGAFLVLEADAFSVSVRATRDCLVDGQLALVAESACPVAGSYASASSNQTHVEPAQQRSVALRVRRPAACRNVYKYTLSPATSAHTSTVAQGKMNSVLAGLRLPLASSN